MSLILIIILILLLVGGLPVCGMVRGVQPVPGGF